MGRAVLILKASAVLPGVNGAGRSAQVHSHSPVSAEGGRWQHMLKPYCVSTAQFSFKWSHKTTEKMGN